MFYWGVGFLIASPDMRNCHAVFLQKRSVIYSLSLNVIIAICSIVTRTTKLLRKHSLSFPNHSQGKHRANNLHQQGTNSETRRKPESHRQQDLAKMLKVEKHSSVEMQQSQCLVANPCSILVSAIEQIIHHRLL